MKQGSAKVRLYVRQPLGDAQSVVLTREAAHYLFGVMRLDVGAKVALFNGTDGEWQSTVVASGKRGGVLLCNHQSKPQQNPPDLWLLFAPIKKARTDFIVEKASEMGAARILPIGTDFTNAERIRRDRLQAHAVEAAEQCGGTYVPEVAELQKLAQLLADWPDDRQIMFCDETLAGVRQVLGTSKKDKWAILIGPEGGFSAAEQTQLRSLPFVTSVSLGPRILRADTAVVAAMTCWQSELGDWQ